MPARLLVWPDENHWITKGENSRVFYREVRSWLEKYLLAAPARPDVPLCVAVALAGMAGGRLVAAALEPPRRFYPCWFYFTVETLMAVALLAR